MTSRVFWSQKSGTPPGDWEDGCAISERLQRIAVTDGASASFMAREWARAVAREFVGQGAAGPPTTTLDAWLEPVAARHEANLVESVGGVGPEVWYIGEAAARGSFCTLLGVEFGRGESAWSWNAISVGDTCLFQIRDGVLVHAFPETSPAGFGSSPHLLRSVPHGGTHGGAHVRSCEGELQDRDVLVVATDGFAEWALSRSGDGVWEVLAGLPNGSLMDLVDEARMTGEMVNDDVTVVRCRGVEG